MLKKQYVSDEQIWLYYNKYDYIPPKTKVNILWGIRWAHIYKDGKRLGKILRSAAKQKFIEI